MTLTEKIFWPDSAVNDICMYVCMCVCLYVYHYVFHSDSVSDEVIGTHFIDLSAISNDGANGKPCSMFHSFLYFPAPSVTPIYLNSPLAF